MPSSESEPEPEPPVVKLKPNPFLKEVKEENPRILCMFCRTSTINDVEFGPMYQLNKITVHYFCMLFSSGLKQNGLDNEGILGFLGKDIEKELRRGEKLKCRYCKKANATVGCIVKSCKASFHFTCGLPHGTLNSYLGNFPSYCPTHKPKIQIPIPVEEWNCEICYCEVSEAENPMWPPCCKRRVFHRNCIQRSALASGSYHFKCPTCKDAKVFPDAMKEAGVFVPEKDAEWELEPNAFSDQATLYSICDAEECQCPQGRNYNSQENPHWKVIRCGACGSQGTHMVCGQLELQKWKCPGCLEVLRRGRTCISTGDGNTIYGSGTESDSETDDDSSEEDVGSSEVYATARYNIARKSSLVGVERQVDKVPDPSELIKPVEVRPTGKNCVFDPRLKKTYRVEQFPTRADSDSDEDEICIERVPITAKEDSASVSSFFRQFVQSNTVVNSDGVKVFRADSSRIRQKFADLKISCTLQASPSDISTVLDSDKSIPQTRNPTVVLPDASDSALETSCKIRNLDLSGNDGRVSLSYVSAPELDNDIEITEVFTNSSSADNQRNNSDCENINPGQSVRRSPLPERYKTATANGQENLLRASQSLKRTSKQSEPSSYSHASDDDDNLPCTSRQAVDRLNAKGRSSRDNSSKSRSSSPDIIIIEEKTIGNSPNGIPRVKKGMITFTEYDGPVFGGTPTFTLSSNSLGTEGKPGRKKSATCSKKVDVITLSDSDNDSGNSSGANTLTPSSSKNGGNAVSGLSESDDDIMIIEANCNSGANSVNAPTKADSRSRSSLKSHSSLHKRKPKTKSKNGLNLFKRAQTSPESTTKKQKRHKFS